MNSNNKTQWQIPRVWAPRGGHTVIDYDNIPDEIKAKFIELCPTASDWELAEWFGISRFQVYTMRNLWGIRKDRAAVTRRGNARREVPWKDYFDRLRKTDPERYREVRQRAVEKLKKTWRRAEHELLCGMKPTTKLNPTPLSAKSSRYKRHLIYSHGYFSDPRHPYWICYDSQTRRSAEAEANAVARGFAIVEGAD